MRYYDVADVLRIGTPIPVSAIPGERPSRPEGVSFTAIVDNKRFAIAPDVTARRDYQSFYATYAWGYWEHFRLYTIPAAALTSGEEQRKIGVELLEELLAKHAP